MIKFWHKIPIESEEGDIMICPKCNKEIPDNSEFCNHCGEKITTPIQESEQTPNINGKPIEAENNDIKWSSKRPFNITLIMIIVSVVIVFAYFSVKTSSDGTAKSTPAPTAESDDTDYDDYDFDSSYDDYEEDEETPEPTKTPKPVSAGCLNALDAAESYLDYDAFSKKGLIKQLKFEGYSSKEAKYAVNHVDVSWKEQAVKMAESYMDYSSFSKSGLIKQLRYEGFTKKQAEYGVKKAY